jgi:hypothetical protein
MASGQVSPTVLLRSGKDSRWHISPVVVTISFGIGKRRAAFRFPFGKTTLNLVYKAFLSAFWSSIEQF